MSQMEPPYSLGTPPNSLTPQMVMWQQKVIESREAEILRLRTALEEILEKHDTSGWADNGVPLIPDPNGTEAIARNALNHPRS